jgi:hypothetical protein
MSGSRFAAFSRALNRGIAPAFDDFVMMLRPVPPAQVIFLASGPDNLVTWRGESQNFRCFVVHDYLKAAALPPGGNISA